MATITKQQVKDNNAARFTTNGNEEITGRDSLESTDLLADYIGEVQVDGTETRTLTDMNTNELGRKEIRLATVITDVEGLKTFRTDTNATLSDFETRISAAELALMNGGGGGGGTGTITDEQFRLVMEQAQRNEERGNTNSSGLRDANSAIADAVSDIAGLTTTQGENTRTLGTLMTSISTFNTRLNTFTGALSSVNTRIDNLALGTTAEEKEQIAKIPNIIEQIGEDGAVGQNGTGIKGDIKFLRQENVSVNQRLSEIGEGSFSPEDLRVRHGITMDFPATTSFRGSNDQDFVDNNPGVVLHRATGEFTIPAITLSDIPAGTRIKLSGARLNPGLTGRTVGFNPILYYVVEQGISRVLGGGDAGSAGTDQEVARNWAVADSADSFTTINDVEVITGSTEPANVIVRWIAIFNGEDATIRPSLSPFDISFVGQYEPLIVDIVEDTVTDIREAVAENKAQDVLLEGSLAGQAVELNRLSGNVESNTGLVNGVRTRLAKPQYQAIEEGMVVPVGTQTLDATALNNQLGGGSPFAKRVDGAIDTATKFTFAFNQPNATAFLGSGRVAHVHNGRLEGFELIEQEDARTDTSEVRYITTPQGLGTRTRPAILEFGLIPPGSSTPLPADNEVILDTGIPTLAANQRISRIAMAFGVRRNSNWDGISNELSFNIRSGEVRTLPEDAVPGITITATALSDGRIVMRESHVGGGNPDDLVLNGGAIRFDAGYTIETDVAEIPRGQRAIDLGAYTGEQIITVDTIQAGDSDTLTAMVTTETQTFNLGYFLSNANRLSFATDNSSFTIFETEPAIAVTPQVLSQLDGADAYLGLFARTNHHADVLRLLKGLQVPTSDGTASYNLADQIQILLNRSGSGEGLSMAEIEGIVRTEIGESTAIQLNTMKPTELVIDRKITTAISNIVFPEGISDAQAADIVRNNSKISFKPENSQALDAVILDSAGHDTLFGGRLLGEYPENDDFEDSNGDVLAVDLGDIVTQNGKQYQALEDITSAASSYGPSASPESWRDYAVQTAPYDDSGLTQLIDDGADARIVNSLLPGKTVANYVRDEIANSGSGGGGSGISLEAVANEMRADGDVANIPIGTAPEPLQAETDMTKDRDIIVPDNALFRTPSTVRFLITSNVINAGNNVPVSLRYTDDDSSASGERPAFTDGTTAFTFQNIDLTRPIAFRVGTTTIQTITFASIEFINTKTGDGSLVDEITQVGVNSLALDTGKREAVCTLTASGSFNTSARVICSGGSPTEGIGLANGEIRFTSSLSTWSGVFTFDGEQITATRVSGVGVAEQVWSFEGVQWNFSETHTRQISVFPGEIVSFTVNGEITLPLAGEAVASVREIIEDSGIGASFRPYHRGIKFDTNNYFDNDVFSRGFSYSSGATTSTTPPSVVSNPPGTAYNHAVVGAFLVSPGFNRAEDIHVRAIIRRASTASHIAIADGTTAGYGSGFIIPAGTASAQVSAGLLDGTNEVLVSNPVGGSNTHTVYAIEMILRRTGGNITMDWGFNSFTTQQSAFDSARDPYASFSQTGTITKAFPTTGLAATRWFQVSGGTIIHDLQMFTKHPG